MLKEKERVLIKALMILDAFLVSGAFLISAAARQRFHDFYKLNLFPQARIIQPLYVSINDYIVVLLVSCVIWISALYLNGMYRSFRVRSYVELTWIVVKSAFFTAVAFSAAVFILKFYFVSRSLFVLFMFLSIVFISAEKVAIAFIARKIRRKGYNFRRLLIVGTGRRAAQFIERVNAHAEWGFKILGIIDDDGGNAVQKVAGADVIGKLADISRSIRSLSADEVVFLVPRSRLDFIEEAVYACETLGVKATVAMDLFDLKVANARATELDGIPFITFETTPAKEWQLLVKRLLDILISGFGIIVTLPAFVIIAILVKAASKGPVFFAQKRIGTNGRKFLMFKFRTMYEGSHKRLKDLKDLNEMEGPVFKLKDDPRATPIGRFLRRFSLDELPQLINVFLGNMSLIGPRPAIPEEVSKYEPWQRRRLSMRPGITCLWQVSGRNKIKDFNEWINLDLLYIDEWSLWLDFKIFIKTIPVVLFGAGAY